MNTGLIQAPVAWYSLVGLFWYLLLMHALGDYALQQDSMAKGKNRHNATPETPPGMWVGWLTAHAMIHGFLVSVIMMNFLAIHYCVVTLMFATLVGMLETALHWLIDFAKCEGKTTFLQDQALHVGCKLLWVLLVILL